MGKNIGKNISKVLLGKYRQKFLDHAKKSATDALTNENFNKLYLIIHQILTLKTL